ncbi:MAG TPA: hypothetical protein VGL53_19605, partial [Bryobacteraceae bacterium]
MKLLSVLVFVIAPAFAAQEGAGLRNPWDFKKTIDSLTSYSARLGPMLDQVKPAEWRDAPSGYIEQQKLVKSQLQSITYLTANLAKDPERVPVVLDLFFRYENFEITLTSLVEGVRRYQNPAVADLITGLRN